MNAAQLAPEAGADVLQVEGLCITNGSHPVVQDANLTLRAGEIVALVGSSGSGKTLTARALLGMIPFRPGRTAGRIRVQIDGAERCPTTEADFRAIRGSVVGMLWQDARGALDPMRTVGAQIREAARLAGSPIEPADALSRVGFPNPAAIADSYPHTLSGGMAQRAAIAVALARRSRFLLADEPTTGLDPAVQREVLLQLRAVAEGGAGILFITHDLRLLPGFADRVAVMDDGRIVEEAARVADLVGAGRALVEATRRIAGGVL